MIQPFRNAHCGINFPKLSGDCLPPPTRNQPPRADPLRADPCALSKVHTHGLEETAVRVVTVGGRALEESAELFQSGTAWKFETAVRVNVSGKEARFLASFLGSIRFPSTQPKRRAVLGTTARPRFGQGGGDPPPPQQLLVVLLALLLQRVVAVAVCALRDNTGISPGSVRYPRPRRREGERGRQGRQRDEMRVRRARLTLYLLLLKEVDM